MQTIVLILYFLCALYAKFGVLTADEGPINQKRLSQEQENMLAKYEQTHSVTQRNTSTVNKSDVRTDE